jgi:hypothetical protein
MRAGKSEKSNFINAGIKKGIGISISINTNAHADRIPVTVVKRTISPLLLNLFVIIFSFHPDYNCWYRSFTGSTAFAGRGLYRQ